MTVKVSDFIYNFAKRNFDVTHDIFMNGYCYYFAHMLKIAFERGEVCWAAPFSHFVWVDDDGTGYDIDGEYQGEAFYFIPEKYLGFGIDGFKHSLVDVTHWDREMILNCIKHYCIDTGTEYILCVENFLKGEYTKDVQKPRRCE